MEGYKPNFDDLAWRICRVGVMDSGMEFPYNLLVGIFVRQIASLQILTRTLLEGVRVLKHKYFVRRLIIEALPPMSTIVIHKRTFDDEVSLDRIVEMVIIRVDVGIATYGQRPVICWTPKRALDLDTGVSVGSKARHLGITTAYQNPG